MVPDMNKSYDNLHLEFNERNGNKMEKGISTAQMIGQPKRASTLSSMKKGLYKSRYLYFLFLPVIIYYAIFNYAPMYGLIIAFKKYHPALGIWGSPWVGLTHIKDFLNSVFFWRLIWNTLTINIYDLLVGFPAPIILALLLNEVRKDSLKRTVQTIVYLPHFISVVVLAGMITLFLSPSSGIINALIKLIGGEPIHFLAEASWFKSVYVWSGVWQGAGWGSIIYLAALAGIDPELYEAATVDGATNIQKLIKITLPCLLPTIIIMFILRVGSMFSVGFEKVMLLYNPSTYSTADVISTYVYRQGIQKGDYSYTAAIGLFNNILNFATILFFNTLSKKLSKTSLW